MSLAYILTGYGILILLVSFLVAAFFLWIGAKIAKIGGATFLKALLAAFLGIIAGVILGLVPVLGWLLGIVAYIVIIKYVFNTDWVKAIIAWLISFVAAIIVELSLGLFSVFPYSLWPILRLPFFTFWRRFFFSPL